MVIQPFNFHHALFILTVQVYIYNILSTLSTLLKLTYKILLLSLNTSTKTLDTSPSLPRSNWCGLDNALLFFFVDRLYGPGPTYSTKQIQVILFIYKPNHCLPTKFYPLSIATMTANSFSHECPPMCSVQHRSTRYP